MTTSQKQVFYENGRIVAKEHPLASQNAKTFIMSDTGIQLDYDLLGTPKQFSISGGGINFQDGTNNYTTGLERLALVQTAFQAVELPPNATTLKINDTILVDAGVATQSTTIEDGKITINNASVGGSANPLLVLQNNNTTAGGATIETYKNDLPTSTGGDTIASWSATCNTNIGKTEIARINQIAYGVGASNNDGGIALACKVNSTISTFLTCNGGVGSGEIQITKPITNPTGDITLDATSSSGIGNIILNPKTTAGSIVANGSITANGDIFMEDQQISLFNTTNLLVNNITQNAINILDTNIPTQNEASNLYTNGLYFLRTNTTTSQDQTLGLYNDSADGGELIWTNTSGTNGLTIESNQDLDLISTKAGGFINMTSVSSIDITATGDNLVLRGGAVAQLEATGTGASVILKPETTAGDLVLEGANIESGSAGGNSGQYLRIKLNGTYYKIKLETDT